MQQTISVTRALAELKNINERINNAIQSGVFLGLTKGKGSNKVMLGVGEVASATATIQGSYDKVDSLIAQRQKIKAALVKSNAETTVSFQGREISVAEAIELKSTVSFKELYLGRLRNTKTSALQQVDSYNSKLDTTIQVMLQSVYGADKSKVDPSQYDSIANPQKDKNEVSILDPKGIDKVIESLEESIQALKTELDFTLSESNARTTVTI